MKPSVLALLFALLGLAPAQAQINFQMPPPAGVTVGGFQVVTSCGTGSLLTTQPAYGTIDTTGKFCINNSGGSSGLSVVDQTIWVQGTSAFTPSGGVFNDTATLSSGQEGTFRLTTKRAVITDVDTTGSALYSAITSGVGTPGAAVPTTGIYFGGNVAGNFRGWTGVNPTGTVFAQQGDIASVGGTQMNVNYGSTPGAVPAVPTNTFVTNTVAVTNTPAYGAAQLSHQVISISSSGNNTAITRSVGTIKVYQLELSCASQLATIIPQDGTSTSLGAKSATQYIYEGLQTEPLYTTTSTNNFVINLSAGVTCTGFAKYKDS